jgi:hypothetical protein
MMSSLDPGKAGRQAKRSAGAQKAEINRQKKLEDIKLAEEEDALGRRKLLAKKGGRSLLVATSPTGAPNAAPNTTLGGSQ